MSRRRPEKPLHKQVAEFVIFHLADKAAFHPFTGTDYDAWHAFIHTVRLWGRMRDERTETALRNIVACAQRDADVLAVFKKSIPCLLDWSDEKQLWPRIYPRMHMGDTQCLMPICDGERICHHVRNRPCSASDLRPDYNECMDCGAIWKPAAAVQGGGR